MILITFYVLPNFSSDSNSPTARGRPEYNNDSTFITSICNNHGNHDNDDDNKKC